MTYQKLLLKSVGIAFAGTLLMGCETFLGQLPATAELAPPNQRLVTILIQKLPGPNGTIVLNVPGLKEIDCEGVDLVTLQFVLTGPPSGKFSSDTSIVIQNGASVFKDIKRAPGNDHLITVTDNCSDKDHYFKYDVHVATDKGDVVADPLLKNY